MSATSRKTTRNSQNGTSTNGAAHDASPESFRSNSLRTKWPSRHSRRDRIAVLQSTAEGEADLIEVSYQSSKVTVTLTAGGQKLLCGAWDATVTVDGKAHAVTGPWELNLWHADVDCDYLEVTCKIAGEVRIDRQILLSRTEKFALLADAVVHPNAKQLEYVARLELQAGVSGLRPGNTRELRLGRGKRSCARVFPVGLPQDVVQGRSGNLSSGAGGLELHQSFDGSGLFAPLVIDWHPERRTVLADWRALTVTEEERVVRPDRASGNRLRVGPYQLLIYRSLQATDDTRCLLGYHTRFETAIGQFLPTGNVHQIMATVPDES